MGKNLIPEIAKMLDVEVGEEFKVKGDDNYAYCPYCGRRIVKIVNKD